MKLPYIFSILGLLLGVPCLAGEHRAHTKEKWITIFVHGTIGLEKHLCYDTCMNLFQDSILYTPYHLDIERKRLDLDIYKNQPIQAKGLHQISSQYPGATLFSQLFDQIANKVEKNRKNRYYTFGWTGVVSVSMRYRESYVFYQELKKELELIKNTEGAYPKIRIIGYSHGGNIALNLAQIQKNCFPDDTFSIHELILLGVPLQKVNAYAACEGCFFKKIYNCYSPADFVQCIDIFSPLDFFSNRTFCKLNPTKPSTAIYDIELRMRQLHNDQLYKTEKAHTLALHNLRKRSPGHIELWFFNFKASHYHTNFCLNPLPLALFLPAIIDSVITNTPAAGQVTVELFPQFDKLSIYNSSKRCKQLAFISSEQIERFKAVANDFYGTMRDSAV